MSEAAEKELLLGEDFRQAMAFVRLDFLEVAVTFGLGSRSSRG